MAFEGKSRILMVIHEKEKNDSPGQGWGMWVIQYLDKEGLFMKDRNGNVTGIKIVCGSFTTDPGTGEKRYYAKGMGLKDFDTLRPKWKEAEAIMKNPPPLNGQGDLPQEESPF